MAKKSAKSHAKKTQAADHGKHTGAAQSRPARTVPATKGGSVPVPGPAPRTANSAAYVAAVVSCVLFGALLLLHYATEPSRCSTGVVHTLTHAVSLGPTSTCARIHRVTSSCLLLSGHVSPLETTSTQTAAAASMFWGRLKNLAFAQRKATAPPAGAAPALYERDWNDILFTVTWAVALLALRGLLMEVAFKPLGHLLVQQPASDGEPTPKALHKASKRVQRFAEQAWITLLYSTSFALVCYVALQQPFWPARLEHLWIGYPHTTMTAAAKALYLWEASNYLHQLITINLEEKRSDDLQMMTHHVVTLMLISASYVCCFYRVGIAVLFLMDPSDILLGVAKLVRYMGLQTLCDALFGLFMLTWTVMRHVMYIYLIHSCVTQAPKYIAFRSPVDFRSGYVFTPRTYYVFITLLCMLQVLLLVWYSMIVGVAYRVLTKAGAADSRSDDSVEEE